MCLRIDVYKFYIKYMIYTWIVCILLHGFLHLIIGINYPNKNHHEIYRAFACKIMVFLSVIMYNRYNNTLYIDYNNDDIEKFTIFCASYILYDIITYFMRGVNRIDIYIHHLVSIIACGAFYNNISFLTVMTEMYSMFNWIEYISPENSIINKFYKLFIILIVRPIIWVNSFSYVYGYDGFSLRLMAFPTVIIMDIYWMIKLFKNINRYFCSKF
jgi:hypothetical protein